jgi:hypothetical protein
MMLWYMGVFFGYIAVAVVVTVLLVKLAGSWGASRRTKTIVGFVSAAIFVLIPTWDMIPGQRYFKHLCETEAGLKIYKTVEGVEGFRNYSGWPYATELEQYGYQFIEGEKPGLGLIRLSRSSDGTLTERQVTESISRYGLRETREPLPWNVLKVQHIIFAEHPQEQLATWTIFYYSGNWVQKKYQLGAYNPCGDGFGRDFPVGILKPIPGSD